MDTEKILELSHYLLLKLVYFVANLVITVSKATFVGGLVSQIILRFPKSSHVTSVWSTIEKHIHNNIFILHIDRKVRFPGLITSFSQCFLIS
ncbi:hypothetical protein GDO81_004554 [Engystomops pustulosus]|uniref:Uncharacterized protein n=1 Tax=Engystomops pustulosus TaxID=76066 RepID=A0AAV7A2H0_ENGPU|nr:hypothetical protein GDO81_004554 [Engystomops pustulosus]